ncbi:hypothetical protein D3C80_1555550 [compost metagenome]
MGPSRRRGQFWRCAGVSVSPIEAAQRLLWFDHGYDTGDSPGAYATGGLHGACLSTESGAGSYLHTRRG